MKHVQNYIKINGHVVVIGNDGLAYASIDNKLYIFESEDAARDYLMEGTKEDEC